ncbi:MAG: FHA domain-containing protein [Lentisphaerae bacterium]|nr:FHA domain-containing protein [Lentisphaerota bacterium]
MSASASAPVCYLKIRYTDRPHELYRIDEFPCRIGRSGDCDITVQEPSISSLHAVLALTPQGLIQVEDQWSTNGIYLDRRRVTQCAVEGPLELLFGRVHIDIALREADLARRPAAPRSPSASPAAPAPSSSGEASEAPASPHAVEIKDPPARPSSPRPRRSERAEPPVATVSRLAGSGRRGIVCPHCWHRFDVEEFLFVARHQSLVGDPVLGADAQQRFLPSRFTPEGNAVDAAGMSCPDMACPRCHLRIPQAASEMPPLFLSIVGATASGKSYFLTSMTWRLRNTLSRDFAINFTDTDAVNNQIVNDFEETIFLQSASDELVALQKTELQGELYNQVLLDGMLINLPKPFMFTVTPSEHHPQYEEVRAKMSRTLVLYDNAGEHFEPGMDSVDNPTTQHLLHSDTIFFLFDPTKDVRFRARLSSDDPQVAEGARVQRQEIILTEMINRIKKYSGMRSGVKTAKTLVIIVSKFDVWRDLLDEELPDEPWQWDTRCNTCVLDIHLLRQVSYQLRCLLETICPEMVTTAESFAGDVLYIPNSALGHSPELNPDTGMVGIRPRDVKPFWVSVPMLYFFYEKGFIPALPASRRPHRETVPVEHKISGDVVFVKIPGREKPLQVPVSYLGCRLRCPGTQVWFDMPVRRRQQRQG